MADRTGRDEVLDRLADFAVGSPGERRDRLRAHLDDLLKRIRSQIKDDESDILEALAPVVPDKVSAEAFGDLAFDLMVRMARYALRAAAAARGESIDPSLYKKLLEHLRDQRSDPGRLAAALRHSAGVGSEDDAAIFDAFEQILAQKGGSHPMADAVDLGRFDFDTSSLPAQFRDAQAKRLYLKTVSSALVDCLGQEEEVWIAAMTGILLVEGHTDPTARTFYGRIQEIFQELSGPADPDARLDVGGSEVYLPNGARRIHVYEAAYQVITDRLGKREKVYFQDFARTGRAAAEGYKRRPPSDPGFPAMVRAIYDDSTRSNAGGGGGGGFGRFVLPPLTDPGGGSDHSRPDNARAVRDIYIAFQLEQVEFFRCVDRIVDLFMAGLLPIGYDEGARRLDQYYWNADERLTEAARWSQYSRALGASGGQVLADVNPNVDFNTLLLRFISAVADSDRNRQISSLFDGRMDQRSFTSSGEQARKTGRDFLANVSLYGWAGTYFTAERFARHIDTGLQILQLPQVRESFGVTNQWQVIERVAQREFGITVNVVKHVTLAEETRNIMTLLADKHAIWGLSGSRPLFTMRPEDDDTARAGDLSYAESESLFRSVQYWLAVNGVNDSTVNEYRQPTETVAAPSLPGLGPLPAAGGAPNQMPGGDQLRQMVMAGQMPSMDQLRTMVGV